MTPEQAITNLRAVEYPGEPVPEAVEVLIAAYRNLERRTLAWRDSDWEHTIVTSYMKYFSVGGDLDAAQMFAKYVREHLPEPPR